MMCSLAYPDANAFSNLRRKSSELWGFFELMIGEGFLVVVSLIGWSAVKERKLLQVPGMRGYIVDPKTL